MNIKEWIENLSFNAFYDILKGLFLTLLYIVILKSFWSSIQGVGRNPSKQQILF